MVFTQEHKKFIIESYFRNGIRVNGEWTYNIALCMNDFRDQFPGIALLEADFFSMVRNCVQLFRETGSVHPKGRSGRPSVRTVDNIETVRARMEETPTCSLRRLSQEVELSFGTCRTIVKKDLGLFPYKMQAYHELLPADFNRRILYCQWFNEHLTNNNVLDLTFFSDEAWFHLSGYINSQTMRLWSAENPHIFRETPLHPLKIGVWLGVSRRRLIGPIFFEGSINAQRYRDNILTEFVNNLHDDELQQGFFQQDGATAHTTPATIDYLQQFFDDRLISLRCVPEFPPRSPDLTVLDYFVFPYLKNRIFKSPIQTLPELRDRIVEECAHITPLMLQNAFENMKRRVNLCLQENGGHFQHML